ncbi:hypothetical protein SAMN05192588_2526 [Nonlabens sp. Hel1_33_55]|nr:hypothetical protein SAMN05192588_2526 [Nonlabens sp. Hel1_33_55]
MSANKKSHPGKAEMGFHFESKNLKRKKRS